jgi:tetratricopeptide (TPR) repeat protein
MGSLTALTIVALSLCLTVAREAGAEETAVDAAAKAVPAAASTPATPAVSEPVVSGAAAAVQRPTTPTAGAGAITASNQQPTTQTAGISATPAGSQPPAEDSPAPTPGQQRFLDAVQSLEAEGGAYDAGLAEQLLGLGASYQAAGRHTEAAGALSRAAHIVRVNEGLYSISDLPILERLIESYSALGEWDGVGSSYQQMFQIHRRNYGDNDVRMLPALQRLSAWHLSAYLADVGENPINHLEAARNLYESSLGILRGAPAGPNRRLEETLRESAIVDYYLASYLPADGGGTSFSAGPSSREQAGPAYALMGFTSGRDALARVVELRKQDPSSSPLMRGQAVAELGDWHQLFNRRQTALDIYKEAWTQAAADSSNAAVNQIFGQPIALPVLPEGLATLADAGVAPGGKETLITVAFAVSERGLVEDIRIVEPQPSASITPPEKTETADTKAAAQADADTQTPEQKAATLQVEKLRKRLRATRFRPRFEAGLPMPTTDVTYSYRYSP